MKQQIIDTLEKMLKENHRKSKYPNHVLYIDLEKELESINPNSLRKTLRELWEEKTIKAGRTINDTYIKLQEAI
ncbi:hypothetical protein L3073_05975 [Ancylomarina sp. DW003]|nr:hypothetical protein [Ancylomarina sp. DW003]MDE5421748.1 hypothetical protein [Ancylomarina sp. DW003]